MREPERSELVAMRRGEMVIRETTDYLEGVEQRLLEAAISSPLRARPNYPAVTKFLLEAYRESWGWSE